MKTFISFILLILSFTANAQFHIGIKAGTNITKIDGIPFKEQHAYNYLAGGFMEIGLSRKIGFQTEALFNQISSSISDDPNNVYNDFFRHNQRKVKLSYFSVPVLLEYRLIGKFLSIQAGPQFSTLINKDKNLLQNGEHAFKNGDVAIIGGLSVRVKSLRLTGRYFKSVKEVNHAGVDNWKNEGYQLALGLSLF